MRTRFDHAVVVVGSLAEASSRFRDAGFVVTPGGRHDALPTENALVAFADGSYLELLACREPAAREELRALRGTDRWEAHLHGASAIARRFLPRLAGPDGVGDAVIGGEALARFAAESRRRLGTVTTGPVPMRRERRGADALAWTLLLPADDGVPFLIEDETPRDSRVPGGAATAHANGASGVAAVEIGSREPAALALRLADLFEARLESGAGRTRARFAGIAWDVTAAETDGARGVRLAGTGALPAAIEALGVRGPS